MQDLTPFALVQAISCEMKEMSTSVEIVRIEWWVVRKEEAMRRMVQRHDFKCEGEGRVGSCRSKDCKIEIED